MMKSILIVRIAGCVFSLENVPSVDPDCHQIEICCNDFWLRWFTLPGLLPCVAFGAEVFWLVGSGERSWRIEFTDSRFVLSEASW